MISTQKIILSASAMDFVISNLRFMMVPVTMVTNYYLTIKPSALNKSKTN